MLDPLEATERAARRAPDEGAHGRAALELTAGEVGRADRKLEVVGQLRRRLAIAFALLAVALEALGLLVEILAARDDLRRCLRGLADRGRRLRLLVLPAAREG